MNDGLDRFGEAQAPARTEDRRLLTGGGEFTDDFEVPNQAYAAFLRAQVAHADIRAIDTAAAEAADGVLGVYTSADLRHLGTFPCSKPPVDRPGNELVVPPRHVLAIDRVRHVGEPIACVVAETYEAALDAAELIDLTMEPLPAVQDVETAVAPGAVQLYPNADRNIAIDWTFGDSDGAAKVFDDAAHVARVSIDNNRLAVCAMEPRAAIASYDPEADKYTLRAGSQGVIGMRNTLANAILRIDEERLRVLSGDVGGGFGMKTQPYPEYAAILVAAKNLGRPVRWTATRGESFLSDNQARDGIIHGELALDGQGRFLGLRASVMANMGAYLANGPGIATRNMAWCLSGMYALPIIHLNVKCIFTNTAPIGPYRGAGRPEASYVLERLVDQAAADLDCDPIELRRMNLIPVSAMPYQTAVEQVYDSGDFAAVLDAALPVADWSGFEARRQRSADDGKIRGIGIACVLEHAAANRAESARITVDEAGQINVYTGAQSQGQGHFTSFAQVVAEQLGVSPETVLVCEGDSDTAPNGGATTGSRSLVVCGGAFVDACGALVESGMDMAAHILETSTADIEFREGRFLVAGTDRAVTLHEVAIAAAAPGWPGTLPPSLAASVDYEAAAPTYPNGCHICEVEIDPDTGQTTLCRYAAVDDVGRIINQTIVDGQVHGAIVQGVGQVLTELCVYGGDGQLLTGSFMDYAVPRADDVPSFDLAYHAVPCTTNPLGAKGAGESGTIGALPAVSNAVMNALRQAGVQDFEMPASPERIWRALRNAAR